MPHAALCVLGQLPQGLHEWEGGGFNAARSIVCVGTPNGDVWADCFHLVSMPHAALCVLGHFAIIRNIETGEMFQCRTQHCVCWDEENVQTLNKTGMFQCRTQHCVCWDLDGSPDVSSALRFNAARSIVCVGTSMGVGG